MKDQPGACDEWEGLVRVVHDRSTTKAARIRRTTGWLLVLVLIHAMGSIAAGILAGNTRWFDAQPGVRRDGRGGVLLATPASVLTMVIAIGAVHFVRMHRLCKRAQKAGCLACTACIYDLSLLPTEGTCPECGRAYTHDELRETWKRYTSGL